MSDQIDAGAPAEEVVPTNPEADASAEAQPSDNNFKNSMSSAVDEVMGEAGLSEDDDDSSDLDEEVEEVKPKAWKLKVGGKEIEIKDEEELVKRAQMGFAANEKWEEAAKTKKQVMNFIELLQNDPVNALTKMGLDLDDIAENHIKRRIEELEKSPEQLEQERIRKELEALKLEKERHEEELRQAEMRKIQDNYAVELENDISSVLETNKNLPKSPYVVKRVADVMIAEYKRGNTKIQVKDVVPFVEKQIMTEFSRMFGSMPEDMFEKVVGKEILTKYRKNKVKKARKAPKAPTREVAATGKSDVSNKSSNEEAKRLASKDFFRRLGTK